MDEQERRRKKEILDLDRYLRDEKEDLDIGGPFRYSYTVELPKLFKLAIRYSGGFIRSRKHAAYVLFVAAVLVLLLSVFLFFNGQRAGSGGYTPVPLTNQSLDVDWPPLIQ